MSVQELNAARDALITPVDTKSSAEAQVTGHKLQLSQLAAIGVLLSTPTDGGDVAAALIEVKALEQKANMKLAAVQAIVDTAPRR